MKIKDFEFNFFGEKTYILYDESTREAAIVDPGMMNTNEDDILNRFIDRNNLVVRHIIATHIHVDHVMGLERLGERYDLGLEANDEDAPLASRIAEQTQMFRLPIQIDSFEISHKLKDGDKIKLGNEIIEVIAVPGHSKGSIALYVPESHFVVTGDALFKGSIGRTDLPGGDYGTLIKSITTKLMSLPDDTIVYPGHGPATTIGWEKRNNPFL